MSVCFKDVLKGYNLPPTTKNISMCGSTLPMNIIQMLLIAKQKGMTNTSKEDHTNQNHCHTKVYDHIYTTILYDTPDSLKVRIHISWGLLHLFRSRTTKLSNSTEHGLIWRWLSWNIHLIIFRRLFIWAIFPDCCKRLSFQEFIIEWVNVVRYMLEITIYVW